jgi:hypothetical protein
MCLREWGKGGLGPNREYCPFVFSADETEDVGEDLATPVTEDYKEGDNKFTGTIDEVTIAVTPQPAPVEKDEERARPSSRRASNERPPDSKRPSPIRS